MNPLKVPRLVAALVVVLVSGLLFPLTAQASPSCDGRFAVGGYPRTELVPDGYQYVPTPGGIFPHENRGYAHGQAVGAQNLIATVDEYAARCDGPIAIFGHSYGAAIVDTATLTLDGRLYAKRVHVHVTGSPRHPGGIEDSWRGLPGFGFRGPVHPPANMGSYRSECNPRDAICDMPPWWNPIGTVDHWIGYAFGGTHNYS